MEVHQLRYFLAVAEHGGMRAAARACGVTQPSLSKQIQKLEEELGRRLFDRLPRGAALTAAGQSLRPRAEQILGGITRALDAVRADLDIGRGRLRVGAIPTLAPFALPGAVTRFRRRFPDAELSITEDVTANLVEALAADRLDVATSACRWTTRVSHTSCCSKNRCSRWWPPTTRWPSAAPSPPKTSPAGRRSCCTTPTAWASASPPTAPRWV